jgi:hypothetical protein
MSAIESIVTIVTVSRPTRAPDAALEPGKDEYLTPTAHDELLKGTGFDTPWSNWQEHAVATYRQSMPNIEEKLRTDLANRLYDLTGREVMSSLVYADLEKKSARVRVDGVSFRLTHGQVVMLSPCAHCGVREFESPAIEGPEDLGYALSLWKPYCPDCAPEDPPDCG